MRMRSWAAIVTLASLSATVADGQDTVTLKDGTTKQGLIQEIDFKSIKLASGGGGTTTLKLDDVTNIAFGALTKEQQKADDEFNRGKFEDAAPAYQPIIENKKIRSPLRQEAAYKQGVAWLSAGKADEALKSFKGLLAEGEFPQSRYLEQVIGRVVTILAANGKGPEAVSFLESEESRLQKVSESGAILERLKLLKAKAYLTAGDAKKAKGEAATIASGTSPSASDAKVLLGDIAVAEKNLPEAEAKYRDAMKTVTTKSGRAGCFNGLGSILLEQGKEKRNPDLIREALLLFLRTTLVEVPEAGEPTEAHENGIYNAAVAFQYLGQLSTAAPAAAGSKTETKAAPAADEAQGRNISRARELFRRLLREYPQSKHANDAQTRLQSLGG